MKRAFSFRAEPYGWRVFFYNDREKWARSTARNGFGTLKSRRAEAADGPGITSFDMDNMLCYMGVFDCTANTMAHEASHAAVVILQNAGVKIEASNGEPLAYLVGFIVGKCTPKLKAAT